MHRVPEDGDPLSVEDVDMIVEYIIGAQEKHPHMPTGNLIALVLLNVGDRYATMVCQEQEWSCLRKDLVQEEGKEPKCPNGHSLKKGPGMHLAWVSDTPEEGNGS